MEIHAQVTSQSKLFSGASTAFGGEPNSHVSLVDAAMPGMLPVINAECVKQAVRTGLGLKADQPEIRVRPEELFLSRPAAGLSDQPVQVADRGRGRGRRRHARGESVTVGIERVHLEQDAEEIAARPASDPVLCRSQPRRRGPDGDRIEARSALLRAGQGLRREAAHHPALSRHLRWRHGERQPARGRERVGAQARCAARCEIKNVNSIRFIGQAIEHEARRQIEILEDGGKIDQETRLFDPDKGETRSMRNKEEAHDYRYFPDPDLLPLELSARDVEDLAAHLPELPDEKRFMRDYGLSGYDAGVLVVERDRRVLRAVAQGRDPKLAANWVINELAGRLNKEEAISRALRSTGQLAAILDLIAAGTIPGRQGLVRDLLDRGRRSAPSWRLAA